MKLKTTKVFVPIKWSEVTKETHFIQTGELGLLQQKELFCYTKEEFISIISDAFEAGKSYEFELKSPDHLRTNYGTYTPPPTKAKYVNDLFND